MGFRLNLLMFSAYVCILTGASLAVTIYQEVQSIWVYPILVFAWIFCFAFAFDILLSDQKFSRKKLLVLTLGLVLASSGVTHAVWVVGTPKWSFTVSTDKSVYALTESVHITVTLTNLGYIPHSVSSMVDPSIVVEVWSTDTNYDDTLEKGLQMWYTPFLNQSQTTLTIPPGQSLIRTILWNQTVAHPESSLSVTPGTYLVEAFVPDLSFDSSTPLAPFHGETYINVTATN
jgi:hypothetical protein